MWQPRCGKKYGLNLGKTEKFLSGFKKVGHLLNCKQSKRGWESKFV
jgi:hypothetical protein